ncbi:gluconokinase [Salpingoeca rosetta]|uniref:Gluconokinase n=1 Tax=Salpingoeca rosetta (strain ATCC 50818 / BSB-021) TaxID=946362 RepID=F2UAI1_SALR5|nr:gluconokinase [Salpingoeca rosetta]EGD73397.1 gluconokinase [Salpingoeca rosetta]|eukprot:XP_004993679.1 gluconokinase [Salpingoeca rosetta]
MVVVVVMGVSGCGKTTVAAHLAQELGCEWVDGDGFHPQSNIAKMRSGTPLTDADRIPWLLNINKYMKRWVAAGKPGVVACSALKKVYRDVLAADIRGQVLFVHLQGPFNLILRRMKQRQGHFMPAALLQSQFDALEPPDPDVEACINLDIVRPSGAIVQQAMQHPRLQALAKGSSSNNDGGERSTVEAKHIIVGVDHGGDGNGDSDDDGDVDGDGLGMRLVSNTANAGQQKQVGGNDSGEEEEEEDDEAEVSMELLCSECLESSHVRRSLREHRRSLSQHNLATTWKCEACTLKHEQQRQHGDVTPRVVCSMCKNAWNWFPTTADGHRVPLPVGPWICPSCEGPARRRHGSSSGDGDGGDSAGDSAGDGVSAAALVCHTSSQHQQGNNPNV